MPVGLESPVEAFDYVRIYDMSVSAKRQKPHFTNEQADCITCIT